MSPYFSEDGVTIYHGDCLSVLSGMAAESVNCVVTSPPYYGLRDYGVAGQIGLERTYVEYIDKLVTVFREVRRVLRSDGTCWLNIGDSYATGAGAVGNCPGGGAQGERWAGYKGQRGGHEGKHEYLGGAHGVGPMTQMNRLPQPALKPKDLMMIPARLAIALQADGWYLRSDIIWHKPNPMPESVTDRPTKAHEYIFLLAKSERYHYDAAAISEVSKGWNGSRFDDPHDLELRPNTGRNRWQERKHAGEASRRGFSQNAPKGCSDIGIGDTRNKRTVWTVAVGASTEAHFATFPEALIEPCIKAGCATGGTVLDPFGGSGTTAAVARRMGCKSILIELNQEYCELAVKRLRQGVLGLQEISA